MIVMVHMWIGMLVNNGINLHVEFVVMSVSICSPGNNYYTVVPSIYVRLGNAIDWSI